MPDFTGGRRVTTEFDRLIQDFKAQFPTYEGWTFDYEYPGYFVYYHPRHDVSVYFTPDHTNQDEIDIQVQMRQGDQPAEVAHVPFVRRTAENLFHAVRPWLEKYL